MKFRSESGWEIRSVENYFSHSRRVREGKTQSGERRPVHLRGEVTQLLIDNIHVPFELQTVLDTLSRSEAERHWTPHDPYVRPDEVKDPRYEVTLRFGKRHEPWITAIRPLTTSP